ncbi:MAG: hypothetical protein JWQ35_739 [Bacteriovoracaceae bacterium]|nr:hypothetical protein [Bacteriovoracaceae bacterium]
MKPVEIKKQEKGLEISWSDHQKTFANFGSVRKSCTCAVCKEIKVPLNDTMPFYERSITLQKMELVGNYAIEILWGDGHRSIVSFDRLRASTIEN